MDGDSELHVFLTLTLTSTSERRRPMAGTESDGYIVFQGKLDEYLRRVEAGELSSRLQAPHAPPCKFQTAFSVISGIRISGICLTHL